MMAGRSRTEYQIVFHQQNKVDLLCYTRVKWTQHHCTHALIPLSAKYASTKQL